ncbi:MAG: hypothetical protein J6K89_03925 [Oscillospiraceae bacterium]|nr:hypothetical protein [Oscillospiraceae bacterium]
MIGEKGLLKAMKAAWKTPQGYIFAAIERSFYIRSEEWEALFPVGLLPRKCLALAVEHIGEIPQDGEAYCCTKKMGAQMVTTAMIYEDKSHLESAEFNETEKAERTRLMWDGYELWQEYGSLQVIAIDPASREIVSDVKPGRAYARGSNVIWIDKDMIVCVRGKLMPGVARKHLSAMQWIGSEVENED